MGSEPGMVDVRKIALGCGWPEDKVDDRLREWVVRLWPGAQSVEDLSADQRAIFAAQILANAGYELPVVFRPRRRGQAGYYGDPGGPVTPGQVVRADILAGELGWTRSLLVRFLRKFFRVDRMVDLGTKRAANRALRALQAYKLGRDRRREAGPVVF